MPRIFQRGGWYPAERERLARVDEAERLVGSAETVDDVVPNPNRSPVIVSRNIDDPHVSGDFPPTGAADGPIGVVDFNGAAIDQRGHQRDMAKIHMAATVEYEHRIRFRCLASIVDARRGAPPLPGIAR